MLSSDLRNAILSFIEQERSAAQLEEWLVPRLRYYLENPDDTDANVAAEIELGLVELSKGRESEDSLRVALQALLQRESTFHLSLGDARNATFSSAVNHILTMVTKSEQPQTSMRTEWTRV